MLLSDILTGRDVSLMWGRVLGQGVSESWAVWGYKERMRGGCQSLVLRFLRSEDVENSISIIDLAKLDVVLYRFPR